MIKARSWKGQDLRGEWQVYRKLDGVRALRVQGRVVSRKNKPLYNLDHLKFTDAEIWLGDWDTTVGTVRTKNVREETRVVWQEHVYELDPPDPRLYLGYLQDPTAKMIRRALQQDKRKGCDGLVLRQGTVWLKVKHVETFDVKVIGVQPGKGKHVGKVGSLLTSKGKVGTGLIEIERRKPARYWLGKTIEVSCRALTKSGKFIEPRFERLRIDK